MSEAIKVATFSQLKDRKPAYALAGEVDLVARKDHIVAFIEVKWRQTAAGLDTAIDARRLARVCAAAEAKAHRFLQPGDDMRIDVLLLAPGQPPRHLENAGQF